MSLAQAAPEPHAGRMCPVDYHYPPAVFDRPPDIAGDTLYVAGGLYGNLQALDAIERLAGAEFTPPTIVFNGDFHWFDAEPAWFAEVERRVTPYPALRGNVETEIARTADIGAGCGCAYPPDVDEDVVRRSNDILRELHAQTLAAARAQLARLPMHLVAQVGALRVGIVHGDATSLAGWRFASDNLGQATDLGWLDDVRRASRIDLFASTHTGLAVLRDFALPAAASPSSTMVRPACRTLPAPASASSPASRPRARRIRASTASSATASTSTPSPWITTTPRSCSVF